MLSLRHLAVRNETGQLILSTFDLDAVAPGVLFFIGPAGAGKSSLLRGLAGKAGLEGRILLHDRIPSTPVHVSQRDFRLGEQASERCARHHSEQVLAALAQDADWYLLDEPTAGLDGDTLDRVRHAISARARQALVIVVTHNRRDCLELGGTVALLAAGRLQEAAPVRDFFTAPSTLAGRDYVASGSCRDAPIAAIRHGIWWAVPGLLCGLSRPGLVADADTQLAALVDGGIRTLFCLEETVACDRQALESCGIALHHVPVSDMMPPTFDQALAICRHSEASLRRGAGVAMQCRGGLGRTGVALAVVLVWFGDSADDAIARVRAVQPHAIQSPAQCRFIREFAARTCGWNPAADAILSTPLQGVQ